MQILTFQKFLYIHTYTLWSSLQDWGLSAFCKLIFGNFPKYLPSFSQSFWSVNDMQVRCHTLILS